MRGRLDRWLEAKDAAIPQPNPDFDPHRQVIGATRDRERWQEKFGPGR